MRSRVLTAVLVGVLILGASVLAGCGGGGAEEPVATDTKTQTPAATPPPPVDAAVAAAGADRSPEEPSEYEPFPTSADATPKSVLDVLESKQPMIVYFYDSTQKTTNDEKDGVDGKGGIDQLMSDYRGTIELVSFDIGRFVKTGSDGTISVDPALAETATAKQTVALATKLGVKFTPYVVIVDSEGYIIARFRGWDDWKNIEREVLRAVS